MWRRARDPVHSTRAPHTSSRTRANVCAHTSSGGDALAPPLPPLTPTRYKSSSCKPYFGTISVSVFIANLRIRNDTPETSSTVNLIAAMFRMFWGGVLCYVPMFKPPRNAARSSQQPSAVPRAGDHATLRGIGCEPTVVHYSCDGVVEKGKLIEVTH